MAALEPAPARRRRPPTPAQQLPGDFTCRKQQNIGGDVKVSSRPAARCPARHSLPVFVTWPPILLSDCVGHLLRPPTSTLKSNNNNNNSNNKWLFVRLALKRATGALRGWPLVGSPAGGLSRRVRRRVGLRFDSAPAGGSWRAGEPKRRASGELEADEQQMRLELGLGNWSSESGARERKSGSGGEKVQKLRNRPNRSAKVEFSLKFARRPGRWPRGKSAWAGPKFRPPFDERQKAANWPLRN